MSFLDSVIMPKGATPTPTAGGISGGGSGSFLNSVVMPTAQGSKVANLQNDASDAQQQSNQANSLGSIARTTISDLGETAKNVGMDFVHSLWNTYSQTPAKLQQDIQSGANDVVDGNPVKGAIKATGRGLGDMAIAVFSPISSAIGSLLNAANGKGGQHLIDGAGNVIADKSGITNLPAFQKFAMEHPNAGEDFNRLLTLFMSKGAEGKVDPQVSEEATKVATKVIEDAKTNAPENPATPTTPTLGGLQPENAVKGGFLDSVEKPSITQPTEPAVSKETQLVASSPLAEEAKKYKSAEEFVNSQPTYFHATKAENVANIENQGFSGKVGDMSKASGGDMQEGVFLYPEKSSAEAFGKNFKNPSVLETRVSGKIYDANSNTKYGWEDDLQTQEIAKDPKIIAQLRKDGYVGVKSTELGTDAVFVFDKSAVKTKSQLTDFYNRVTQETPEAPKTSRTTQTLKPIEGTGDLKARGLSQNIEASAIEKKLSDNFGDLPEYRQVSMSDQALKAADLISKDPETARAIAMGEKAAPKGMIPESVMVAVEHKATMEGDVETLKDLANSKLSSGATTMGQRIRALGERDSASPVEAIRQVQEARQAALEKRGTTLDKATAKEINDAQTEVRKARSARPAWEEFVQQLTCNI